MKRVFFFFSVCFLFAFALLSKYEDRAIIRNLDFTVTVKVQDFVGKFCTTKCDGLFEDIGFFAGPLFSVVIVLLLTGVSLLKEKGWKKLWILSIPALFALLTAIEVYGKTIVRHPAPPFFMLKNPTTMFPTYHVWQEFSYPSGHTARSMFLGILFYSLFIIHNSKFKRIKLKLLVAVGIIGYIFMISLSRIYLGHHWLSDVIGGWLLGAASALLPISLLRTSLKIKKPIV